MRTILLLVAAIVSLAAQAFEPLVREDRVWEYEYTESNFDTSVSTLYKFKFDGTIRINDVDYHKLNCWKADDATSAVKTVAFMREQGNRVYVIMNKSSLDMPSNLLLLNNDDVTIPNDTQAIIYDTEVFDELIEGIPHNVLIASDKTAITSDDLFEHVYKISPVICQKKTIEANGKTWTAYVYAERPSYLESLGDGFEGISYQGDNIGVYIPGIGNVNSGLLYQPWLFNRPMNHYFDMKFVDVRDLYGNIVFDARWLEGTDTVKELPTEAKSESEIKTYDLTGKEVENPESGTIYIRDGKKQISR